MSATESISLAATFVGAVLILATLGISRYWPQRSTLITPEQGRYLMDQLVTEKETARVLRAELDVTKSKISSLEAQVAVRDQRITSLEAQVADLWAMVRGQMVAQSSVEAAQPGNRGRAPASHMTDDDVAFKDWVVRHFDTDDLIVLAANAGMGRPVIAPPERMATDLVQAARRTGNSEKLEREAFEMRPDVEAP